ncbi:MAG: aminotransferase [Pseudomonadales bacterium]|nr:aminotransferase [Pseudomonadales bacterium]
MTTLANKSSEERTSLLQDWVKQYELVSGNRLSLDLSRGKPAADQLALSDALEDAIDGDYRAKDGTDVRNYGGLRGLPETRALGAELLDTPAAQVMAGGNSSLALMHLVVNTALEKGLWQDGRAWQKADAPTLITPVPGYDRHFTLTEALGIKMVAVDMTDDGPNMDQVRSLVTHDPNIKGIWNVPKYSNPTGCTYSGAVVDQMAQLPNDAAADDFVILWDNAYAVHDLEFPGTGLASIYEASVKHNTEDHVIQFASTSKITFAGAGIAFIGSGSTVLDSLENELQHMTIGPDKVNQLRHSRFLAGRIEQHMRAHAELLKPKFDVVLDTLERELGGLGIAEWTRPKGGYFVSLDVGPGLAKTVIQLAENVGLTLTPAGATFPHGKDPEDRNVRIAPTFAALDELTEAMLILTLCIKLATAQGMHD